MASAAQTHPIGQAPGAGLGESSEALTPSAVNSMLMEFLVYFGRAVLVFYPVYLTGYLGLSISWVLLCMVMISWWKMNRQWKDARMGSAIDLIDNETDVINAELKNALQMATWVNFTDVEKVQWVNKVLEQAWPFFGMYMEKLLKENIQQSIRGANSALKTFTFTKIHFGYKPLKITSLRAYTHEVGQREVILDLNLNYDSNVVIDALVTSGITVGLKGIKFRGMLRVILDPLIGRSPLVGGVTLFFIRRPTLEIDWTGMTNVLDSPAFGSMSEDTITDIIASYMVLPNRMCFPLMDQIRVDQMRFPLPHGAVRVHVVEARDLVAKDTYMMGLVQGKSDPYTKLRVGNQLHKTKTIKENLHPKWNEVFEFVVHEAPGQELEVELFDEDTDKDDFLGRYNLDLGDVKRDKVIDKWYDLEGVPNGSIHFRLQWLSLKTDRNLPKESNNGLACAMLGVYLDNASHLPNPSELTANHKHGKHPKEARLTKRNVGPNSYVELSIDKNVQKSKVVLSNKNPSWEEGFTFFVQDVNTQQLIIQVKDQEKKSLLGLTNLPLSHLLGASDMTMEQVMDLQRSGANSQIKLKASLRILYVEPPPPPKMTSTPQVKQQKPPIQQGANTSTSTASSSGVSSNNASAAASSGVSSSKLPAAASSGVSSSKAPATSSSGVSSSKPPASSSSGVSSSKPPAASSSGVSSSKTPAASSSGVSSSKTPAASSSGVSSSNTSAASSGVSSSKTSAASSSGVSSSKPPATPSPSQLADFRSGSEENLLDQRRRGFLASEPEQSFSKLNMRRYDSHSLLSENSIASSRFDLSDGVPYAEAIKKHQGSFGEINLTVNYASLRKKLTVKVNSCRNLFPCGDSTDSYVRLYLLPDHSWRHRKKTQVKKKTVNPEFHDKFEFDVSLAEAQTRKLDVAVKNNKMFHKKERQDIGMVLLDLSEMDIAKGVTEWYELTLPGLKRSN